MADLSINSSAQPIYIMGSDSSGNETYPIGATAAGELKVTSSGNFQIGSAAQISPLGRLRVTEGVIIFDAEFKYGINARNFQQSTAASATITTDTNKSQVIFTSSTGSSSAAIMQSRYFKYYAGCSYIAAVGAVPGTTPANCQKNFGFFDSDNGLFFRHTSAGMSIVVRSKTSGSVVDNVIAQSSWNIDVMNGTGSSGINLDYTLFNVFLIDYTWQGVGGVRFGILTDSGPYWFHKEVNHNVRNVPYMQSATLPMRAEIRNTAITTASSFTISGMSLVSEMGIATMDKGDVHFTASTGVTKKTVSGTQIPLLSIRPKATFNSATNRVIINPESVEIITAAQVILVRIVLNPTLTGASWTSVNSSSSVEFDIAATAVSGGTVLYEGFIPTNGKGSIEQKFLEAFTNPQLSIDGTTQDIYCITGESTAGGSDTYTSILWNEEQ